MKILSSIIVIAFTLDSSAVTPFMNELLNKPNGLSGRAWLGVTNGQNAFVAGTNITFVTLPSGLILISAGGLPGSGTVTSFSSGGLSPLFTTSVATATTTPALSFSLSTHTANTVFSGPSSGGAAAPTFRALVVGDIPALDYVSSTTVRSDNTFLGGPASGGPLAPTFRTISLDDLNDVVLTAPTAGDIIAYSGSSWTNGPSSGGGGGGGGSIDIPIQPVNPTTVGTNFTVDFQYPAQVFNATGTIAFTASANVGANSATSRVANIFIQSTNYGRRIVFTDEATNWHAGMVPKVLPAGVGIKFSLQAFGGQYTNIQITSTVDLWGITNAITFFDYNSISGLKLYIDASRIGGVWQDYNMVVPAEDGSEIRGLTDWSGTGNHLTNNAAATMTDIYRTARTGPFGVPCIAVGTGSGAALNSPAFSALTQPNWVFILYWSLRGGNPVFDSQATGARISCDPGNYGGNNLQLFCGTSLTTTSPTNNYWTLFSFKCNGASSIIRTNGVQATSGNAGAGAPLGFRLGTDAANNAVTTASYVAKLLVYNANLSGGDVTSIENALMAEYAIPH